MGNVRKLWENSNITEKYPSLKDFISFDEPMSAHTTFRVGGPADVFVLPGTIEEFQAVFEYTHNLGIPVSLLGGGSNLLVSDRGIRGVVVSLSRLTDITRIKQDSDLSGAMGESRETVFVRCHAGCSMQQLVDWCEAESLMGLQRFSGLPGSVGGAVFMNARCYDISIADVFFQADVLHFHEGRCTLEVRTCNPIEWEYKRSPFQSRKQDDPLVLHDGSHVLLSLVFALVPGNRSEIRAEMDRYYNDRVSKGHFTFPSAGSMFKNDRRFGKPSGMIIDETGLRGFRIGDAQVAPWHGNIVINAGAATATDIRNLVREVQQRVVEKTGFFLEPEVIIAGDWEDSGVRFLPGNRVSDGQE